MERAIVPVCSKFVRGLGRVYCLQTYQRARLPRVVGQMAFYDGDWHIWTGERWTF